MNLNQTLLTCAAIGLVTCCLAIPAHSQEVSAPQCPVEYWPFGAVCIHRVTGDVVYVAAAGDAPGAGCSPRYWRHGEVCIDPETGDVEIADKRTRAAGK
jgi:hypothetical protein